MSTGKKRSSKRSGFIHTARTLVTGEKRNVVLAGALGTLLFVTGLFALVFRSETAPVDLTAVSEPQETQEVEEIDTAEPMEAIIKTQQGVVEYKTDGAWMSLDSDMQITAGMSIRTTGAASRAAIEFGDSSVVRIDAGTEIMFETLTEARIVINQSSGHAYNRVTASSTRSYVVQTENAQFQSVGTAFRTSASGDEESVEVFHSSVREVTTSLEANEGEKIIVTNFANPEKNGTVERLSLQNIKEDRFITWNRDQDKANDTHKNLLGFLADYSGPAVTVIQPAADSTITVDTNQTQGSVQIQGTTEAGATLSVRSKSIAGSEAVGITVKEDGAFTTPELKGPLGSSVFEFVATDRLGNKTWKTVTYNFAKKSVTQEQGIVLSVNENDPTQLVFEWALVGMTTPGGIYLVASETGSPAYPADAITQVTAGSTTTADPPPIATTYKVCRYDAASDSCDVYSNAVVVEP